MQWKSFAGGFVLAGALGVGGAVWLAKTLDDRPIYWPSATFYDDGDTRPDSGYVVVEGALTGEDMDGDTFLHVECRHEAKACRINELHQWRSPRGVTLWNDEYAVTSWGPETIIAESSPPPTACNRVKLVIVRSSKTAKYVRIPMPHADASKCMAMTNKTMIWKIGDQFPKV
jgi:hypothetical protein